jgi:hypothetical protein
MFISSFYWDLVDAYAFFFDYTTTFDFHVAHKYNIV